MLIDLSAFLFTALPVVDLHHHVMVFRVRIGTDPFCKSNAEDVSFGKLPHKCATEFGAPTSGLAAFGLLVQAGSDLIMQLSGCASDW
jgi:hypothetical protein